MYSKRELLVLGIVALAGMASYISGFDYYLAEALGNRPPHGISLFLSTWYYFAYVAAGTGYLLMKRRKTGLALIVSMVSLLLMQAAFTEFAPRARPPQAMAVGDGLLKMIKMFGGSSSFFSGHTASSMAVATAYILSGINPLLMMVLAMPVMVSRITLVQHYVSDVCGGIIFGYVTTKALIGYANRSKDAGKLEDDAGHHQHEEADHPERLQKDALQ